MRCLRILLALSLLSVASVAQTTSTPPSQSDEQTVLRLQHEWLQHPGISEADIAFTKSIMADHFIQNDGLRNIYYVTPAEWEKGTRALQQANPNVKSRFDLRDIKIQMFGDTAVVTYTGTYTVTGYKDSRYNYSFKTASADTWQKKAGQWKILADWNTVTEPVPAELFKLPPLPGMNNAGDEGSK
jgi:hypothetical protein